MAEGSNMDDIGDYRPGLKAAAELSVKSPLREAGLYKKDIRLISKAMGLSTWNKPAYACLASRFVYGEEITEEKLHMIDRAEQFLIERGFFEERVRMHGNIASRFQAHESGTNLVQKKGRVGESSFLCGFARPLKVRSRSPAVREKRKCFSFLFDKYPISDYSIRNQILETEGI